MADRLVAGVDEAGRGSLAGPVIAAAVILDPARPIVGLDDSKRLTASRRVELDLEIRQNALAWALAGSNPDEIDAINILQATMQAMRRAIEFLAPAADAVQVDGNRLPNLEFGDRQLDGEAIVGGDASVLAISAASILAKVGRDRYMLEAEASFPGYGFARHKGYGTAAHLDAIGRLGPCPLHRRSFRPFRAD